MKRTTLKNIAIGSILAASSCFATVGQANAAYNGNAQHSHFQSQKAEQSKKHRVTQKTFRQVKTSRQAKPRTNLHHSSLAKQKNHPWK